MFEVKTDGSENQETEKWYISNITKAIESDDIDEVLKTLKHAWASHFPITSSDVTVNNLDDNSQTGIGMAVADFFQKKIREKKLDPDYRIKLYHIILPYDYILASVFIERILPEDDEEYDNFENSLINSEELYQIQMDHYLWLVNNQTIDILESALEVDGHLDHTASYQLNEYIKEIIIECAKFQISMQKISRNNLNYKSAKKILKALGRPGEFENS